MPKPAPFAARAIEEFLDKREVGRRGDALAVGFSGGLDSTVLLHVLTRLQPGRQFSIRALHVDHGIHPNSSQWAEHCELACRELGIELLVGRVQVQAGGEHGLEALAREARFGWFERVLLPGEILVLAHHADDQLETLLYRLMRGAGPTGLGAMADDRKYRGMRILRPLLKFARSELADYADSRGLCWQDDPANNDPAFDRVYLRRNVLPLIKARWPQAPRQAYRSGRYLAELLEVVDDLARQDLAAAAKICFGGGTVLDTAVLAALPRPRLVQVLRLVAAKDEYAPSRGRLQSLIQLVHSPRQSGEVKTAGIIFKRYRDGLYVYLHRDHAAPPSEKWIPWQVDMPPVDFGAFKIRWEVDRGCGVAVSRLTADDRVIVRRLRAGARPELKVGGSTRSFKKLCQTKGVPPWERDSLPLLVASSGETVAVVGLAISDDWCAKEGEKGIRFELMRRHCE